MKTEVPPSYLAVQTIKFREMCSIWWPTSIENSTFYKKCVFYINQDAPRLFARNFQQFACFRHNLHTLSRCQCILWFSMVLKGSITLHYGTELESFLKRLAADRWNSWHLENAFTVFTVGVATMRFFKIWLAAQQGIFNGPAPNNGQWLRPRSPRIGQEDLGML